MEETGGLVTVSSSETDYAYNPAEPVAQTHPLGHGVTPTWLRACGSEFNPGMRPGVQVLGFKSPSAATA